MSYFWNSHFSMSSFLSWLFLSNLWFIKFMVQLRYDHVAGAPGRESSISFCQLLGMPSDLAMSGGSPTSAIRCKPSSSSSSSSSSLFAEWRRHLFDPLFPHARHHRHPHLPPWAPGKPSHNFFTTFELLLVVNLLIKDFYDIRAMNCWTVNLLIKNVTTFVEWNVEQPSDQIGQYSAMGPAVVYRHISPVFKVVNQL